MIIKRILFLLTLYRLSECRSCPSACICTENSVLCMKKELTAIPNFENLDNSPTIIDLSGNKLHDVGPDDLSFEKTFMVKEIYLNNSEVIDISFEAFDELDNLQELYLGENLLNTIPENFIEDLPNMLLLELSGNQFSINMPIIRSASLEVLSLANSKITDVTVDALSYLPNLKMLLLQQNNIKYIDSTVFENIPNRITFTVRLSHNPWECECKNLKLFEYLARKNYIDSDAERYQCLSTTGLSLDIFYRNTMEINSSLCLENHESDEYPHSRKRNRQIAETDTEKEISLDDALYSLVSDDNQMIIDANGTKTNKLETLVCGEKELTILGVHLGLTEFMIVTLSFFIGIFIGFSVHQCLVKTRRGRLDTSDSTTKLIA